MAMVRMLYNCQQGDRGGCGTRTAIGRAFAEMETEKEMQSAAAELCLPQKNDIEVMKDTETNARKK